MESSGIKQGETRSSDARPTENAARQGRQASEKSEARSELSNLELLRMADQLSRGRPENRDLTKAASLITEAAHRGDAEGQYRLGVCFAHGRGLPQDYSKSVHWFKLAAGQGHAGAQDSLGVRYATGQGVARDDSEAVRWFRKASEQGHAVAQFNLGLAYVYGQGVEQNYQQAYVWFSLSAMQGDEIAAESRDRVAEALTFEQLQQAKVLFHQACSAAAAQRRTQT